MADIHKVGPYVIGNTLGAGATGKVRLAFDKNTGLQVAVKIVRKDLLEDGEMAKKLLREIAVMKLVDHENVLHLYDYYEDLDHMFLVLEYAPNGDLYDYFLKKGVLNEKETLRVFRQIIEGIDFCHKHLIIHRDLKPENILLDFTNNIKIADFGMCGVNVKDSLFETSCGSPHYASPEVIEGIKYDGTKADIWSCGVILYAMVTGKLPFDSSDIPEVLQKVKKGDYEIPLGVNENISELISKMLVVDPEKRISIEEIKKHEWFISKNVTINEDIVNVEKSPCKPASGEIKTDFVNTLVNLGFGDTKQVEDDLASDTASYIKTFYTILENRQLNKRTLKGKNKLNRAKSEAMLPLSKVSKTFRTSSNHIGNSINRSKESSRNKLASSTSEKIDSNEKLDIVPLKVSGKDSKRSSRFLPSWFSSSDAHLKKYGSGGIESEKSITDITTEIEETLDSIGATYSFTKKRDKIKARISKDSKTIKFSVHITKKPESSSTSPIFIISFSRRTGDKEAYAKICDNIRSLLDV